MSDKPRATDYLDAQNAPDAPPIGRSRVMVPLDPVKNAAIREALLWAWTNATGRLPDENTMTPDEIAEYGNQYQDKLLAGFAAMEGCHPDEYTRRKAAN